MTTIANGAKPLAWQASTMPSQIARACCSDNRLMACDASGRKVKGTLSGESNTLLADQRSQVGPLLMGRGWTSLELCSRVCVIDDLHACLYGVVAVEALSLCSKRRASQSSGLSRAAAYYILILYNQDSENPRLIAAKGWLLSCPLF